MSTNLIDDLMIGFRGDTLSKLASALGESTAKTQTALAGVVPALVGGLADKVSTAEGANGLLDLIRRNKLESGSYSDASGALKGPEGVTSLINMGKPLMEGVLGGRTNSITEWVSSFAGINRSVSSSLMSLALPVVLSQIVRRVGSTLNASSLTNLLSGQKKFLRDAPAGLTSIFGDAAFIGSYDTKKEASYVGTYDNAPPAVAAPALVGAYETTRERSSWWKWVLPLLALVALLSYFLNRMGNVQQVRTTPVEARPAPVAEPANLGAFVEKKLPTGVAFRAAVNGVESKLLAFIEDPTRRVDRDTWFTFDRLEFETDSATLKPASDEQLRNIVEILKAHPEVNVKIGGYTDNVGDAAYNLKLSRDRATNTMNEIVRLGIDRERLDAEGYGQQFPVADNATEEGRQRNRRIDIRVTKK